MKIFISYKREDQPIAEKIHTYLTQWDHDPWLDVYDIQPSDDWDHAIHQGMIDCEVVVGLMSSLALESRNVLDEWGWALSNNRRLMILWIEDIPEEKIPPRYIRIQRIDLRKNMDNIVKLRQTLESSALIMPDEPQPVDESPQEVSWSLLQIFKSSREEKARERLINAVHDAWIEGFLYPSLRGNRFSIDLNMRRDAVLNHLDFGDYELPEDVSIHKVFNDLGKKLLILGDPGAGKTLLMLELAESLLEDASIYPTEPIPVVLNLSTWAQNREGLRDWIVSELVSRYAMNRRRSRKWVDNEQIILMLDGLDEVNEAYRDLCVETINDFFETHPTIPTVICSRTLDYEMLANKLKLRAAITLQPLTEQAVTEYLHNQSAFDGLLRAIRGNAALREMVQTPFLFNSLLFTYRDAGKTEVPIYEDESEAKYQLFNDFVKKALKDPIFHPPITLKEKLEFVGIDVLQFRLMQVLFSIMLGMLGGFIATDTLSQSSVGGFIISLVLLIGGGALLGAIMPILSLENGLSRGGTIKPGRNYTLAQSRENLANMARHLTHTGQVLFYIENFSPNWLNARQKNIYRIGITLLSGLIGAIIFRVMLGAVLYMLRNSFYDPADFLINVFSPIIGFLIGIIHTIPRIESLHVIDTIRFPLRRVLVSTIAGLLLTLAVGIALGSDLMSPSGSLSGLALCFGAFIVPSLVLVVSLRPQTDTSKRQLPGNGMWSGFLMSLGVSFLSAFSGLLLFIFLGLFGMGAAFEIIFDMTESYNDVAQGLTYITLALLMLFGFLVAYIPLWIILFRGGLDYLKHVFVRILVARGGELPGNLRNFLDYAVQHGLMRRVGGGYIFVHRMLLDHFVTLHRPNRSDHS